MFLEKDPTQRMRRNARLIVIMLAVFAVMFIGCSPGEENENAGLNGVWISDFDDSFIIDLNAQTLEYDDGFGGGYGGIIVEIIKFNNSGTLGVIFIKYTTKPIDFYTEKPPAGDYIGIYFRHLTSNTGQFTQPVEEYEAGKFRTPAKATLPEAKSAFTVDTMLNISFWSACVKQ